MQHDRERSQPQYMLPEEVEGRESTYLATINRCPTAKPGFSKTAGQTLGRVSPAHDVVAVSLSLVPPHLLREYYVVVLSASLFLHYKEMKVCYCCIAASERDRGRRIHV